MIPALLHHKLTFKQENTEDILTSNVFGMFYYHAQPKSGLFPFLARATTIDGDCPLASLAEQDETAEVKYDFWPLWEYCGEKCWPDVELDICGKSSYLVGIEAKYWSGKSSRVVEEDEPREEDEPDEEEEGEPDEDAGDRPEDDEAVRRPSDQLAREWNALVGKASKLHAQPVLIYLTADLHCPKEELRDSIKDCGKPSPAGSPTPMMCWLSWRELPRLFRNNPDPHLFDLAALADEMQLTFFEGFSDVGKIHADWTFQCPTWRFDVSPIECKWRFK